MKIEERRTKFEAFLQELRHLPYVLKKEKKAFNLIQKFVISYFGLCFVEGYRIFQQIDENTIILSALSYQQSSIYVEEGLTATTKEFRILHLDFKQDINENSQLRHNVFSKILETIQFLKKQQTKQPNNEVQVHFLFANSQKFSKVTEQLLIKEAAIDLKNFYQYDFGVQRSKHNYRILTDRVEGIQLHEFVELFLKGCGTFRNPTHLYQKTLHCIKFAYDLKAVANTICFIIGKQILEHGYISITSQKWMRRVTQKKFKRFDLLLRNDEKVCIIDWKFSKTDANQKIAGKEFVKKNKQYYQLARKEYNAEVELKYYCFHHQRDGPYHTFSSAIYDYQLEQLEIDSDSKEAQKNPESQNDAQSNEIPIQVPEIEELIILSGDEKNRQEHKQDEVELMKLLQEKKRKIGDRICDKKGKKNINDRIKTNKNTKVEINNKKMNEMKQEKEKEATVEMVIIDEDSNMGNQTPNSEKELRPQRSREVVYEVFSDEIEPVSSDCIEYIEIDE